MVGILGAGLAAARWRTARVADSTEGELQFEEVPPWEVQVLGLNRDGSFPPEAPTARSPTQ
jgi:hypothetical protein